MRGKEVKASTYSRSFFKGNYENKVHKWVFHMLAFICILFNSTPGNEQMTQKLCEYEQQQTQNVCIANSNQKAFIT